MPLGLWGCHLGVYEASARFGLGFQKRFGGQGLGLLFFLWGDGSARHCWRTQAKEIAKQLRSAWQQQMLYKGLLPSAGFSGLKVTTCRAGEAPSVDHYTLLLGLRGSGSKHWSSGGLVALGGLFVVLVILMLDPRFQSGSRHLTLELLLWTRSRRSAILMEGWSWRCRA